MTATELDELEALANAATPGPWMLATSRAGPASAHIPPYVTHGLLLGTGEGITTTHTTSSPGEAMRHRRDLAFIAAAREAVPKLIARVRELEEALDEPPCDHCNNCDEGCWGPRRESMQDRGSRALRGRIEWRR